VLLAFAALIPTATRAHDDLWSHHEENFTVYAALDLTNMRVNSADPMLPPGSRGDSLVVDGNLYWHGDGMYGATAGNDPNAAGAIGKIRCRATIITDPSDTSAHFASFVSELYSLPDESNEIFWRTDSGPTWDSPPAGL
jgi:hypothetical protein